jgi:hypothetical protein
MLKGTYRNLLTLFFPFRTFMRNFSVLSKPTNKSLSLLKMHNGIRYVMDDYKSIFSPIYPK